MLKYALKDAAYILVVVGITMPGCVRWQTVY